MFGKSVNNIVVANKTTVNKPMNKTMFDNDTFSSIIRELEEVFRQYKIQKAPSVTLGQGELRIHCMFFTNHDDELTDFLCTIKYKSDEVVRFRVKDGKFKATEVNNMYANAEMELIVLDYIDGCMKKYANVTNVVITNRTADLQKLYLEVVKRRELNAERNSSEFCYIK